MSSEALHHVLIKPVYATVILPIAVPKPYTYYVPTEWNHSLEVGMRVEVVFGKNKRYAALVTALSEEPPQEYKAKAILSIIDEQPVVLPTQIRFWEWVASYYCTTIGEVMNAALPAGLKLSSETRLVISPVFDDDYQGLSDKEYMIAEALNLQQELSIEDVRKILGQKTVYPIIHKLLDRKLLYLKEELQEKYKPKYVGCVRLQEPYLSDSEKLEEAFERLSRSTRQVEALMAYIQLSRQKQFVRKKDIYDSAKVDGTVLKAIEKKGIFELYQREVSRLEGYDDDLRDNYPLSDQQQRALKEIAAGFAEQQVVLLHGVTGSGKTRVYVELIQQAIERGEQVLYLLPEIALTTQIVSRLRKIFGNHMAVYHSRLNNHERVEMWRSVIGGKNLILGARSSLFLPFQRLGLIIIDEEHDPSFKQYDPAPRYNARDAAIFMSHLCKAKTLLGTATPSIESYQNAQSGKYGLVEMPERFGDSKLPKIVLANVKDAIKKKTLKSHFTPLLIEELKSALERGEQAILFQNRRGFAPVTNCQTCGWHSECINCDVSLTYHKFTDSLKCHYCGYTTNIPTQCPACGDHNLNTRGFGTEKIENELKIYLPNAKIGRMDFDTVKGKNAHARIISDFEDKRLDILVGTQMVTKGFDFENVGIVGILSADQLLQFPDFRSSERAFQLMTQVSGRAGRKEKKGKVVIQAINQQHPVLKEVLDNDFKAFYHREVYERQEFNYPPFKRLIKLQLKHKKPNVLNEASSLLAKALREKLGNRVIGPALPTVPRVRNYYLTDILLKIERSPKHIKQSKKILLQAIQWLKKQPGYSTIRVNIDVDPL
ncbi:MAG: primosomal protein N' [Bacteroidota bacterium]